MITIIGRAKDADRFVDRLKQREKPSRPKKAKPKPKAGKAKSKK